MDGKLMSTVVWSLAIFRAFDSPLYDSILRSVKQCDIREFDRESVRRLYQVLVPGGTCGSARVVYLHCHLPEPTKSPDQNSAIPSHRQNGHSVHMWQNRPVWICKLPS